MANKTVTIRPSGGDYTSWAAAIAGELTANPNLITMDGILTIRREGEWTSNDTTAASLSGFTVDSSHYIVLEDVSTGNWLVAGSSPDGTLEIKVDYTRVIGVKATDTTGSGWACIYITADNCQLINCQAIGGLWHGIHITDGATNNHLQNCKAIRCAKNGLQSSSNGPITANYFSNCDAAGCENGISVGINSTLYARNCYSGGNSGQDYNTFGGGTYSFTTCRSEDGTQSTPTSPYSTATFVNVTSGSEDFHLVTGSGLIGSGTDLSSAANYPFNIDADGTTRSAPWDVGAYAFETGPATYSVTYNANGGTGSQTDASSPYEEDATVTVLGVGTIAKPGYTFTGWNTAADGSGTGYASSATFSMPASNVVLYAQWSRPNNIIGHDSSDASVLSNAQVTAAAGLKVYFEDASTGTDIVGDSDTDTSAGRNYDNSADCGLHELHDSNNRYLCSRDHHEPGNDYTWFSTHSGLQSNRRDNPPPATKLSGFLSLSANMRSVLNVAMFKFCWIDVWPETTGYVSDGAAFAASLIEDIESFEASNPGLIVPYWTMPLQSNASYAAREAYNDAIRTYCAENGKWLIDMADIECYNGSNVKQVDGNGREIATSSYVIADGGHLSSAGRIKMANAYWVAMSRIAASLSAHTVSYDGNGSTGGSVPTDSNTYVPNATVTVLGNTGSLVRTGYVFSHWNTAANGTGTSYDPAETFLMGSSNVTLYAQWAATYTVTYNGNSNTGGSAPTDGNSPYASGSTVTVLGNTGSLVRTGYVFGGWNTAADGSGTAYAPAATFAIAANTILYAQWTATYTVTYNGNGSTGGTIPTDSSSPYEASDTVTVLGNTGSLVRTGYAFSEWNTAANGSGTAYSPSDTFSMPSSNVILYAQWTAAHSVTYSGNGSTGGSVPVDPNTYLPGESVDLASHGSLVRSRYTFVGWCEQASGSGTIYSESDTYTMGSADVTLYAIWTPTVYQPGDTLTMPGTGLRLYAAWTAV